jgi:uncharacterized protein
MDPERTGQITLENDTVINVAALLREVSGAFRSYRFHLDRFDLDDGLSAIDVEGDVRLTRLSDAILAAVSARCVVELECQRCLNTFNQQVRIAISEEFRIAYDVRRGTAIESDAEELDERLEVSENHELDFGEPMRQEIIVELPMRPVCGDDCPGPPTFANDDEDGPTGQFAALASLLGPSDE